MTHKMKTKIEIGTRVNGSYGEGTITRIITKSSGYVEVTYDCGKVKKEMAYNLTDLSGELLKNKPVRKEATPEEMQRREREVERMIRSAHDDECGYKTNHSMEYILKSNIL